MRLASRCLPQNRIARAQPALEHGDFQAREHGDSYAAFGVLVAVALLVAPADAHVIVAPAEAPAGVVQRYTVTVPSEKQRPTTRVEIDFPVELRVTEVEAPAGWTATRQMGRDGRIVGVAWAGGTIPPDQSADFGIVALNPNAGATLAWKVIQTYQDGSEVHWTGAPTAESPAAVTVVRRAIGAGLVTTVVVVLLLGAGAAVIVARRARRSVLGAGVGLLMSAAVTSSAEAHAYLDRADPGPGAVLATNPSPSRLVLRFTEAVTIGPGAVVVLDASQRPIAPINARVADGVRVEVDTPALAPGAFAVRWRVTSADSHIVRGTYWFAVGSAPAPPPLVPLLGTGTPTVSWIEVLARWLGLVAALGLAGITFFDVIVVRAPPRPGSPPAHTVAWRAPVALTVILIIAELGRATAQAAASVELPVAHALDAATLRAVLFEGRFAALWWARLIFGVGLAALIVTRRTRSALVVAVLLLVAIAAAGHAVAGRAPAAIVLVSDVAHLAAAALWLGGLTHVALRLVPDREGGERPRPRVATLVTRLSAAALASVLVLAFTGAVNAYAQVGSFAALGRTAYGQSLIVKLALLVPWLALAAVNRFALRPRLAAGKTRSSAVFTTLVRCELGVGVATLLVVGLLGSLPPPAARAWPALAEVARQGGPLRIALRVDPNWVGVSLVRVTLTDASGQPPPGVRRVVLTFTMEGMNMGRTHVTLAPRVGGVWETEGFYFGMPGDRAGRRGRRARRRARHERDLPHRGSGRERRSVRRSARRDRSASPDDARRRSRRCGSWP
ncbi:MAG: hypothetical protein DMD91_18055 [Candidatus Rokuibacteriota bacterium]|nr:MAG: hypothetical protein DMD91_18055 [Candidatus Rokubacteria bacterium]